jgi:hypothetical protein
MSLKFTAMGRLPLLSTIGTRERVEDPLETLTVVSGNAGSQGRLLRGVQLALSGGLCIFYIAASIAFLIPSVSAP